MNFAIFILFQNDAECRNFGSVFWRRRCVVFFVVLNPLWRMVEAQKKNCELSPLLTFAATNLLYLNIFRVFRTLCRYIYIRKWLPPYKIHTLWMLIFLSFIFFPLFLSPLASRLYQQTLNTLTHTFIVWRAVFWFSRSRLGFSLSLSLLPALLHLARIHDFGTTYTFISLLSSSFNAHKIVFNDGLMEHFSKWIYFYMNACRIRAWWMVCVCVVISAKLILFFFPSSLSLKTLSPRRFAFRERLGPFYAQSFHF